MKRVFSEGARLEQVAKPLTLDFGSSHNLRVVEVEPRLGSVLSVLSASDSPSRGLCPPPPLPSLLARSLSLPNKQIFKESIF